MADKRKAERKHKPELPSEMDHRRAQKSMEPFIDDLQAAADKVTRQQLGIIPGGEDPKTFHEKVLKRMKGPKKTVRTK